ncbi:MAG: serine/threonine protein kinase [Deltaproteobacteria bacterium]|nr:serine/threonine protein kinase [Deltaproteobacteria bacterium]
MRRHATDEAGALVGPWRLEHASADGGMARIWRATREADGEPAALKRILPHLVGSSEARDLFADEVRITAMLSHPRVVRYLGAGEDHRGPWLALEWVEGLDLHALLASRRAGLPLEAALCVGRDLLEALVAVHGCAGRVLHRDLSLSNVLVGTDGVARLADFGLARSLLHTRASPRGSARGKLGYLPPEVFKGRVHGTRGDLYGAAAVLWEALAGRRLFDHISDRARRVASWMGAPRVPVRDVCPQVPRVLAQVLDRALELDPEARPGTALELLGAYEEALWRAGLTPDREALQVACWSARRRLVAPTVPASGPRAREGLAA